MDWLTLKSHQTYRVVSNKSSPNPKVWNPGVLLLQDSEDTGVINGIKSSFSRKSKKSLLVQHNLQILPLSTDQLV